MRLIRRDDTSLVLGLIAAAALLFHDPLRFAFDIASDIHQRYQVDVIQALVVLSVVFGFHQYRKRHQARAEALASAAEAHQARTRSEDLERLVGFSRALASASDFTGLTQALSRFVPKFTSDRAAWLLICPQGCWDVLMRDGDDRRSTEDLEAAAVAALDRARHDANWDGQIGDLAAFPLLGTSSPVGILLVRNEPPLTVNERYRLDAMSALTAIAIRNIQTLVETRDRSIRDALTGCANREHGIATITIEVRRARRHRRPLSVLMVDLDGFKAVNDTHGHLVGDQLLGEVGRRLGDVIRVTDLKCRYGGDEFLVALPETALSGAQHVAESIRQALSTIVVPATAGGHVSPQVSIGVAELRPEDRSPESIIARADRALYEAKRRGRNCVAVERPEAADRTVPLRLVVSERA